MPILMKNEQIMLDIFASDYVDNVCDAAHVDFGFVTIADTLADW